MPITPLRVPALATTAWAQARLGRGIALGLEAEAEARSLQDPALLSDVLRQRAVHESNAGDLDRSERLADEALEWARVAGDDWRAGMAAMAKTSSARSAAELRVRVDDALELLERTHNVYAVANMLASCAFGALCHGSDDDALDFVARATPIARDLDHRFMWMLLRGNAGLAALFAGDVEAAESAFREELEIAGELAVPTFMSEALHGLAAVATVHGELERAGWLLGAAGAERGGKTQDAVDERLLARFFEPARVRLGPEAWDEASRRSGEATFAAAVATGLKRDDLQLG